jgi:pimeloyl-ACP methyl ester carboxylesterase
MSKLAVNRLSTGMKADRPRGAPGVLPGRRSRALDGPFTETKELVLGDWPSAAGRYASVNGLRMYYEMHGRGRPLVLLHSALTNIDTTFGKVLSSFAGTRQVIAIEQQAHGRTADIDRPLTYTQMADDTVELLRQLNVEQADFFGFSMGAILSLQIAARYPGLARKMAIVSGGYRVDGCTPEFLAKIRGLDPATVPVEAKQAYEAVAPHGSQWDMAVARVKQSFDSPEVMGEEQLRSIRAHTLIVAGETGIIRREHSQEMANLVPHAQLRVLPMNDHDPDMVAGSASLIPAFFEAPLPGGT